MHGHLNVEIADYVYDRHPVVFRMLQIRIQLPSTRLFIGLY